MLQSRAAIRNYAGKIRFPKKSVYLFRGRVIIADVKDRQIHNGIMASPQLLDIAVLVVAISEDHPTGMNIRSTTHPNGDARQLYQRAKDLRSQSRMAERNRIFEESSTDSQFKNWQEISQICQRILTHYSKDLEVCTWLLEAALRLNGITGLRDGLKLLTGLLQQHWGKLFPEPDEEGMETTLIPLQGLNGDGKNGTLLSPLNNMALSADTAKGQFCFWQLRQARDASRIQDGDERTRRESQLGIKWDDILHIVQLTPASFYVDLIDDLRDILQSLGELDLFLNGQCAELAPSFHAIRSVLNEIQDTICNIAKDKLQRTPAAADTGSVDSEITGSRSSAAVTGMPGTRQQALAQLREIAQFFRQTEPHSPISYAVEKAIRWGERPLHELLSELIPDENARSTFSLMTGICIEPDSN